MNKILTFKYLSLKTNMIQIRDLEVSAGDVDILKGVSLEFEQ